MLGFCAVKRDNYLERILRARVYDVAIESPLEPAIAAATATGSAPSSTMMVRSSS